MRFSDSGVVMRICGGLRAIRARSRDGVSPVRTPARSSGGSSPIPLISRAMPSRGGRRFRSIS